MNDSCTEQFVGRLVRRGWKVAPLGGVLSLHNEDNFATLVAVSLSRQPKDDKPENEITSAFVLEDVRDVLKRLKIKHYSVIVTQYSGCTWQLGNITKSEINKIESEQKKIIN